MPMAAVRVAVGTPTRLPALARPPRNRHGAGPGARPLREHRARRMNARQVLSTTAVALALAMPLALMARASGDALPATPTTDHTTTSRLVFGLLSDSRYSYRPRGLDATLSQDIFRRYLEALDGNKLFFDAADIARFKPFEPLMGDAVRTGNTAPAMEMYALYKQRVDERVEFARGLLDQDIFDFEGDERWHYDREDAEWAADRGELDALWTQSVRNDWLRLKLAGKTPGEIRATLDKRYANMAKSASQLTSEDAFQTFLNAYTASIDPHTDYFNP